MRPKTAEAFPALSKAPIPEAQWVTQKSKKQEPKSAKKVAPAPELPANTLNDFPALSRSAKSDKAKKSSSVLVNLNTYNSVARSLKENANSNPEPDNASIYNNSNKKQKDSTANKSNNNKNTRVDAKPELSDANKLKTKKKKNKTNNENSANSPVNAPDSTSMPTSSQVNGVVKKRSELNIEPLEVLDELDFPSLDQRKPPPGFSLKPPPGLHNFNAIASNKQSSRANIDLKAPTSPNDLTFTTSSGQCYSILPQYHHPPNFAARNRNLIASFMTVLKSKEMITEFKNYSDLFRKGLYPPEQFYEHCKTVLSDDFNKIFPELLVLLPDIDKQQDLYKIHILNGYRSNLDMCQSCKQVVLTKDLRVHLLNHNLENHFPVLSQSNNVSNVWKKT